MYIVHLVKCSSLVWLAQTNEAILQQSEFGTSIGQLRWYKMMKQKWVSCFIFTAFFGFLCFIALQALESQLEKSVQSFYAFELHALLLSETFYPIIIIEMSGFHTFEIFCSQVIFTLSSIQLILWSFSLVIDLISFYYSRLIIHYDSY